jgi:hypothetical protein
MSHLKIKKNQPFFKILLNYFLYRLGSWSLWFSNVFCLFWHHLNSKGWFSIWIKSEINCLFFWDKFFGTWTKFSVWQVFSCPKTHFFPLFSIFLPNYYSSQKYLVVCNVSICFACLSVNLKGSNALLAEKNRGNKNLFLNRRNFLH